MAIAAPLPFDFMTFFTQRATLPRFGIIISCAESDQKTGDNLS
jgi:hypothetical protein